FGRSALARRRFLCRLFLHASFSLVCIAVLSFAAHDSAATYIAANSSGQMSKDEWLLLRYGLFAVALILPILIPLRLHNAYFPGWASRAVYYGIVISVFVLYQMRQGQL